MTYATVPLARMFAECSTTMLHVPSKMCSCTDSEYILMAMAELAPSKKYIYVIVTSGLVGCNKDAPHLP